MKYRMLENKLMFSIINPETQEQEQYLFAKEEVILEVEDGTLYFTFKNKRYESIDIPDLWVKQGWIEPDEKL